MGGNCIFDSILSFVIQFFYEFSQHASVFSPVVFLKPILQVFLIFSDERFEQFLRLIHILDWDTDPIVIQFHDPSDFQVVVDSLRALIHIEVGDVNRFANVLCKFFDRFVGDGVDFGGINFF